MRQKRCLTIQDYSCLGRCSLTVALPILSAASLEAVGLPTTLSAANVKEEQFDAIAETAINDGASVVNPIMATKEQIIEILKAAK